MEVVKDSYISINFYFVENMQSQMTQTPIKYFKVKLCLMIIQTTKYFQFLFRTI
jgi:hypothetical protein